MTVKELEEFYHDCVIAGYMPDNGLCNCLHGSDLNLFAPTAQDKQRLNRENKSQVFWAAEASDTECIEDDKLCYAFTPLRQTIVLFLIEIKKHPI